MNAAQAKRVPLRELLAALGLQPARQNPARGELWYLSPFREETLPSFKVDEAKNLWYDFGAAAGGNVLDFAMTYFRVDVAEALRQIDHLAGRPTPPARRPIPAGRDESPTPAETPTPTVRPLGARKVGGLGATKAAGLGAQQVGLVGVVGTKVHYAAAVEYGRRPGKRPPTRELKRWAKRKLGDESLAYVVARKIGREGTRPQPYLEPALEARRGEIVRMFERELGNVLKRFQ